MSDAEFTKEIASRNPLWKDHVAVSKGDVPDLTIINGMGRGFVGEADFDDETGSYVSTLYQYVLHMPLVPYGRFRVIREGREFRILAKIPMTPQERVSQIVRILAIGAFPVLLAILLFYVPM